MGKSSKFRGVHWHKSHQKWQAKITMDGILTHLGYFDDDETAARKYDEHAARIGRPINFPDSALIHPRLTPELGERHQAMVAM